MGLGSGETAEAVHQLQDVGVLHLSETELCGRLKEVDGRVQVELARTEALGMEVLGGCRSEHTESLLISLPAFAESLASQGVVSASS
jgi:hypothetical protein